MNGIQSQSINGRQLVAQLVSCSMIQCSSIISGHHMLNVLIIVIMVHVTCVNIISKTVSHLNFATCHFLSKYLSS